jgi:alanine-synthesizing transaminase
MLSNRAHWSAPLNRLTIERRKRSDLLDLTESNPTRASLPYPHDALAEALARGARASYEPDPRGLLSAREALAAHLNCAADDLVLTASTSEAYSFLFKLLCNPGDAVLTATPSYPLFEHLAALELVELRTFPLEFHRRWELHAVQGDARAKAILVVNPNNPTGSFVSVAEQSMLAALHLPVVSDEVFLDYPLEGSGSTFVRDDVLTFTLGGLSKSFGLPHFKLAWIRVSGPGKREVLDALELVADNFLSVATPVQIALPDILRCGPRIGDAIRTRTRANLDALRTQLAAGVTSIRALPVEGGWSVVLRVPRIMTDEDLALALLDRGVVVQPGFFFDFAQDGHLVLSLLTPEEVFAEGVRRIIDMMPL